MKIFNLACLSLTLFASHAFAATYIVKKGDTLANIARTRYGEPVFGPKGTLNKILKQNPNLKPNVPLEPGQKLILEAATKEYPAEKVPNAKPAPIPAEEKHAKPEPPTEMTPAQRAAHQMDLKPKGPIEDAKPPTKEVEAPAAVTERETPVLGADMSPERHEAHGGGHNYFSFIPQYSMITQKATEHHESYTMHSSSAFGAELGWDHWWNDSFSTVLTYSILQVTSKESSEATGSKVMKTSMSRGEIALLNRLAQWVRFGLGMAYGDHFFLEGFPADAKMIKASFLNAFATAEFTAYESERFEGLVNLKIGQLPAQSNAEHPLLSGTEYMLQLSLVQKLQKFAMIYGVAYTTENQTLSGADETRNELAVKVGALF